MSLYKQVKDKFIKFTLGKEFVPSGLFELHQYFRVNDPISFKFEKQEDGSFVAVSQNFRYGSIITSADCQDDLDEKTQDAILTAFEIPSSYTKEADLHRVGAEKYAFA